MKYNRELFGVFHKEGLINQQLAQVAVAQLTIQPFVSTFQAMISELVDLDDHERQILNIVFKRVQTMSEKRNIVIHSRWWVGWGNPDQIDFSEVSGWKYHRSKKGASVIVAKYKVSDFDALSEECDYLQKLIFHIWICISNDFKISKNFNVNDDDSGSIIKGLKR